MTPIKLDSITFRLKEHQDFQWLKKYGKAFWCVGETGSGCVCIGMEDGEKKYFCKIAGVNTIEGGSHSGTVCKFTEKRGTALS